jgi:hypothetical protein
MKKDVIEFLLKTKDFNVSVNHKSDFIFVDKMIETFLQFYSSAGFVNEISIEAMGNRWHYDRDRYITKERLSDEYDDDGYDEDDEEYDYYDDIEDSDEFPPAGIPLDNDNDG